MISGSAIARRHTRWFWQLVFAGLVLYVAARMGVFSLTADVATLPGTVRLPNTFASVDHPFHVARAGTLWGELASGQPLRWVWQHQGGYPVEFYPLGEAWLEALIRALSIGALTAEGAHTLAVVGIFLLPGLAYAALAREDGRPPVVGFLALALHVALPGSWYHGGYTELVQWGLVTNVAGAVAALLMLPVLLRFMRSGMGWSGALAGVLAAWAVYCNPRSVIGLAALAAGAWLAVAAVRGASGGFDGARLAAPGGAGVASTGVGLVSKGNLARLPHSEKIVSFRRKEESRRSGDLVPLAPRFLAALGMTRFSHAIVAGLRLALVTAIAALLAAPLLMALVRFGGLYAFVHYSGYDRVADYVSASATAVSWPILLLGLVGTMLGLTLRHHVAAAAAVSLVVYVLLTAAIAFVPWAARFAPQLEPTRLMPLQRLLVIYLAALAVWMILQWVTARIAGSRIWVAQGAVLGIALAVLAVQTRPLAGPLLDPASPETPAVSLYPVAMSAQPQQLDLETAVRAADAAAAPGTAILVLGSALSWHQQLWAPLWTARPLFYDNWLWYWHPDHAGTPGYRFLAGHHYPDPERTLAPDYLARHGIGAVVVTGPVRSVAADSPLLEPLRRGVYDAYAARDPVTTVTFGDEGAALLDIRQQRIDAIAVAPGEPVIARVNWHPRWEARADDRPVPVRRLADGYLAADPGEPVGAAQFAYGVQPLDWAARVLALVGLAAMGWLVRRAGWPGPAGPGWYARQPVGDDGSSPRGERTREDDAIVSEQASR